MEKRHSGGKAGSDPVQNGKRKSDLSVMGLQTWADEFMGFECRYCSSWIFLGLL